MIFLPYVARGDEGVVESHVAALDATIVKKILLHQMRQLFTKMLHQMKQLMNKMLHQMRKLVSKMVLYHN